MIDISHSFTATIDQASKIFNWVKTQISLLNLEKKTAYHIELCIEEVIVNIINYAYKENLGKIEIYLKSTKSDLIIIIMDSGVAFNPIEQISAPDMTKNLEDRPIGGLGIYFLHELMDSIEYLRDKNKNILTLTKYL